MVIKTIQQTTLYKRKRKRKPNGGFELSLHFFLPTVLDLDWLNHRRMLTKQPPLSMCRLLLQVLQRSSNHRDPRSNLQLGYKLPLSSLLLELVATMLVHGARSSTENGFKRVIVERSPNIVNDIKNNWIYDKQKKCRDATVTWLWEHEKIQE